MSNFGASLKEARESKGISLDQIANDTRISTRFLAAIENEEFHLLPGGIFNRGFVRSFAERVGLDPNQAVADYERLVNVRPPTETAEPEPSPPPPKKHGLHLYPVAIAALIVLIAAFYVVTRDSGKTAQTSNPPAAPVSAPSTPPEQPAPAAEPAPPVVPPETTLAATAPEPAPEPAKEALSLEMEAKEATWIKVTADGNAVVAGEILEPGMTRKFTAQNSIDLTIGNAAGVSLKINDRQVKPLGKSGQVRELSITPTTLKDYIG